MNVPYLEGHAQGEADALAGRPYAGDSPAWHPDRRAGYLQGYSENFLKGQQ